MKKILLTGGSGFIGCNLVKLLIDHRYELINIDILTPRNSSQKKYWIECDVLDKDKMNKIIKEFDPNYIVHLAARTDLRGFNLSDYEVNTIGTRNLIESIASLKNLKKVLFASSRLVCKIGHKPKNEDEYSATTPYGKSKIESELIIRKECKQVKYDWIIFRPTSIWGPWFDEPYRDFFDTLIKGRYVHPSNYKISKSFGFVGNSVFLLEKMLSTSTKLDGKTVYLTDYDNLDVLEWANIIRTKLKLDNVKEVPFFFLYIVASIGTIFEKLGFSRVPLTKFRLNNLITNMYFDIEPLKNFSETLPYDINEGVQMTLDWYSENDLTNKK